MKVQSIDRVFDILEMLSREPEGLKLTEISQKINLPTSTVFRLLSVLRDRNYIDKNEERNIYRLGLGFIELTSMHLMNLELKTESQPFLRRLSKTTGQVVFMGIIQDGLLVYIDKYEIENDPHKYCIIGQRHQLYCTALGKSLLIDYSDEEIRKLYYKKPFEVFTPKTITDVETLIEDIHLNHARGYSFDDEENKGGVICVAAPIYDYRGKIIAAISTSWDSQQRNLLEKNVELVKQTAMDISIGMGMNKRKKCYYCHRNSCHSCNQE